jgi:hypothetical protein
MKFTSDIDIDFADRRQILEKIRYRAASIDVKTKHNTGVYVTEIPHDPATNSATLDYRVAEQRGYIKLDFLNVNVYQQVRDEAHLIELMQRDPPWHRLLDRSFCEHIIHIGNHYDSVMRMPEPVNSIPRLAMFLALIRPGKRELIGRSWADVAASIWVPPSEGYYFKKAHAVSYAHLVVVHMNLLDLTNQGN